MKKLLFSSALALIVSGLATTQSFAAGCCFGLFPRCCGCCGCGAKFCVRQYNAFSPVCSGTVFCDGCCPFGACGGGGYGGYGACAGGMCGPGGCGVMPFSGMMNCGPGGCGDGACLGSLPATEPAAGVPGAPAMAMPATVMPAGPTSQIVNDRPIQNTAFRPAGYVPPQTVAPAQMQPQTMVAPSYWGN